MKNHYFLKLLLVFSIYQSNAQQINYGREVLPKYAVGVSFNWDFAATAGLSVQRNPDNRHLKSFGAALQVPFGEDFFDERSLEMFQDWQITGETHPWKIFIRSSLTHKRLQNLNARLSNLGFSAKPYGGYFGKHGNIGLEAGYERTLLTSFTNFENLSSDYPEIKNGIAFKGQSQVFSVGLRSVVSIRKSDISANVGLVNIGHFGGTPFVPFYFRLGLCHGF